MVIIVFIASTNIFKNGQNGKNNPDYSITLVSNVGYGIFKKGNVVLNDEDTIGQVDSTYLVDKRTFIKLRIIGKYEIPDSSIFHGKDGNNGHCIVVDFTWNKNMIKPNSIISNQRQVDLEQFLIRL